MSSSVIVARTLICRTIVAIMRGGNLCGAMWHRPQLARYRFSPSARAAAASCTEFEVLIVGRGAVPVPAEETLESASFICSCPAAHKTPPSITTERQARMFLLKFNFHLHDRAEMRSDR
jgi:hypothetical protein